MSSSPTGDQGAAFQETPGRVDIAVTVVLREGKFLVARRQEGLHLAGHWEFPGGRVEPDEEPAVAAARELREETSLVAGELEPLVVVVHDYTELPLRFHVFIAREPRGDVRMDQARQWAWLDYDELKTLPMPEANRQMIRALRWRL